MIPIASRAGTQYNLPTMYPWREYVTAGGMVSYGPSLFEAYRLVGVYRGKFSEVPHQLICLSSRRARWIW